MSGERYYNICCDNIGAPVEITCHDGSIHRGMIDRVERGHVFLRPFEGRPGFDHSGHGNYLWGWGFGFGAGIALGTIATLAFLPFFYW